MPNSAHRLAASAAMRLGLFGLTAAGVLLSVAGPPPMAPFDHVAEVSAVTDGREGQHSSTNASDLTAPPAMKPLQRPPAAPSRGGARLVEAPGRHDERGPRRTGAGKGDRAARGHARPATRPRPRPAIELDARTLSQAMGGTVPLARYRELLPAFNQAVADANLDTVRRVAMFCAQVGHESVGLKYMEEIASGAAYNGRADLGNTHPGDGPRFKGRGPIQVTGRANYSQVSAWAHGQGTVPTRDYFVDHPSRLASDRHGFAGVVWYWTRARNMNAYADHSDILGATKAVNGGTNGLADRIARWRHCLRMGDDLRGA